ncbi:MAG: DoxX family protein [Akkermansiaceae bacterium]|jgi:putative oxidoreductase|nr:DoxX family protein [Akkermansiaceae bacterium]MDP4646299.1 DoxX family protein [Akkermansiaceae bacterium]MDP4721467.1 DoxX family protein [Akkermansiaceae bacterium]MDP4779860.1 DoxX family protein [Akkermansiaceae bacterium]MDP4845827.1 DoxX family protein [Akkermansiaceae bacterium]
MKKFFFDCGTRDATASLGLLFLRVCIGLLMFFGHGLGKIQNFAEKKDGFPVPDFFPLNLMSHPVSLMATIGAEVGCSILIILGLATRPAAFIFAFTMTVAAFAIHGGAPWFSMSGPSKEMALLYLVPAVAILLSGAGQYSVDASILKEGRRRRSSW